MPVARNCRAPQAYGDAMPDIAAAKDYSIKQLNATDLSRHCHIRVHVQPGDEVWIGDVGDGDDPVVTLCIKNISFFGPRSHVEELIRHAADLFAELRREPDLADRLLPRIKRRDPQGRRTTVHPLYREVSASPSVGPDVAESNP
jgi:hypothetical protein